MPRSVAGVYTLPGGINPVVAGTTILSTWANPTLDDVAQGVTDSLDRSGRGAMLAQLKAIDGVVAAPGYTFSSELTTGMWRPGASILAWSLGGTEYLRLTTSGLIAPSGTAALPSYTFTGDLNTGWSAAVADTLVGSTSGLNRLQIGPSGNVIIAAPSSGAPLTVLQTSASGIPIFSGGAASSGAIEFAGNAQVAGSTSFLVGQDTAGDAALLQRANRQLYLGTNSAVRLTIAAAGNVTIAAPSSGIALTLAAPNGGGANLSFTGVAATTLQFISASGSTTGAIYGDLTNTSGYLRIGVESSAGGVLFGGTAAYSSVIGTENNTALVLGTNAASRLILSGSGNVTINAPGSGDTANFSQVAGSNGLITSVSLSGSNSQWRLENTSNTASSNARQYIIVAGSSSGDPFTRYEVSGIRAFGVGIDNSDSQTWKVDSSGDLTTATNRFNVTSDGRIYGNAIHNNAGAVTGTTNQYFASGTYTATLFNTANISASTFTKGHWTRVGNIVYVAVLFDATSTAAANTTTQVGVSLPIASNLAVLGDLTGCGQRPVTNDVGFLVAADAANDRATVQWLSGTASNSPTRAIFSYEVL